MAQSEVKYKMLVIGGSAGSLDVVLKIVTALANAKYLSIIIIVHRKNDGESILTNLLAARTNLLVREIEDKDQITAGTIFIAPADYHVLIENKTMFCLDVSEKVHHSRPSIDVTFESVAEIFGESSIGVLLSGANADGAEGIKCIKDAGGFTIVQDPKTADVDFMPLQALELFQPDKILDKDEIGDFIKRLTATTKL